MASLTAEQQRALRRRRKHERQAVVFGSLIAGLALAGLGATAIYTGAIDAPFLAREFTSPSPEAVAEIPLPPCIPEETMPSDPATVTVRVYNGTDRRGLAGQTATGLTQRGFVVAETANYPVAITTGAQILFGEGGIAGAYTLAAHMDPGTAALVLDTRSDATVDLILGETWAGLLDPEAVVIDASSPLVPLADCLPLEQARVLAVPGPTASPEPSTGEEGEVPAEGDAATDG